MRAGRALVTLFLSVLFFPAETARALDLTLPGEAVLTREVDSPSDSYFLPVGPYDDGTLPTRELEGRVVQQAWRIEGESLTSLGLISPLREQLSAAGYDILFDCAGDECGGFDFRFGTSVLPAPDMFVDLFDFRFLSARKQNGAGADYVSALVSVAGGAGYVQLVTVGTDEDLRIDGGQTEVSRPAAPPGDGPGDALIDRLQTQGHVILPDLEFGSGSAALADRAYASLAALARFLKADPGRRIALVGHTDAVGALDANVALSRRRAASVLERLATRHGVPRAQMESNGMGYLAPVAPNTTPEGREANRRVEAVLLNTE